ncbi:hypothetical protein ACFSR6_18265 [Pedobacter vanadiisoli]|uniref:Uncharacterized protein n=1 Tax=Pedobacter vanadiisoli TaxID=1761975 RepID=A0ABW5MPV5_9SPHI
MFGLFRRTKIQPWELELLKNVLKRLPTEFRLYISHINKGLFRGVLIGLSDIPGYVGLSYHSEIYKKLYHSDGKNFRLEGITVFDTISAEYLQYTIYFSHGLINGYSLTEKKKVKIDIEKIDTTNVKLIFRENVDFNRLKKVLSSKELKLINPGDVYVVVLEDKEYFHLTDIEDGNFYALDMGKNLYKITHNPHYIEKVEVSLTDLLAVD